MATHTNRLGIALLILVAGCRAQASDKNQKKGKAAVTVVEIDASSSSPGQTERCSQVVARAHELLTTNAKAVAFLALATGDDSTGNEPLTLVDFTTLWRQRQSFEALDAAKQREQAWLVEIGEECRSRYRDGTSSPIFAGAARGTDSAKTKAREFEAMGADVDVKLFIHSDLRETADPRIAAHLAPRGRKKLPPLPTIDTTGVTVVVCGINDHRGVDQGDVRLVDEVWRKIIPNLSITTSCPSFSIAEGK